MEQAVPGDGAAGDSSDRRMSRTLQAWINEQHVGTLHEANGVWAFEYSANWLAHPGRYPLCPGLPLREGLQRDGGTTRPAQWYFDNLLPEEGQRTLLAGSASLDAHDAFALLAYYGAESAGSVTLLPDAVSEADRAKHPLPDDELSRRIRQMPHIPFAPICSIGRKQSAPTVQMTMPLAYLNWQPIGNQKAIFWGAPKNKRA